MKKEIRVVPKGKSLKRFFKEMFRRGYLKNAWLIVDKEIYEAMLRLRDNQDMRLSTEWSDHIGGNYENHQWFFVKDFVLTKDVATGNKIWIMPDEEFVAAADPEHIFFLKKEE